MREFTCKLYSLHRQFSVSLHAPIYILRIYRGVNPVNLWCKPFSEARKVIRPAINTLPCKKFISCSSGVHWGRKWPGVTQRPLL